MAGKTDWADLAAPEAVVVQARAVLGAIDLDPYTTPYNNRLTVAARIFNRNKISLDEIIAAPWEASGDQRVFVGVPVGAPACRRLANKTLREYRAGRVREAVLWLANNESMIRLPWIWDFPVCLPFRRLKPTYWDDDADRFRSVSPADWSYVVYLPPSATPMEFHAKFSRFHVAFSSLGRVVFDQYSGNSDWPKTYKATIKGPYDYYA